MLKTWLTVISWITFKVTLRAVSTSLMTTIILKMKNKILKDFRRDWSLMMGKNSTTPLNYTLCPVSWSINFLILFTTGNNCITEEDWDNVQAFKLKMLSACPELCLSIWGRFLAISLPLTQNVSFYTNSLFYLESRQCGMIVSTPVLPSPQNINITIPAHTAIKSDIRTMEKPIGFLHTCHLLLSCRISSKKRTYTAVVRLCQLHPQSSQDLQCFQWVTLSVAPPTPCNH